MTDLQRSEHGVSVKVDSRNRIFSFIFRDPHQLVSDLLWQSLLLLLNKTKMKRATSWSTQNVAFKDDSECNIKDEKNRTHISLILLHLGIIHVIISVPGPVGGDLSLPLTPSEQLPGLRELLQPCQPFHQVFICTLGEEERLQTKVSHERQKLSKAQRFTLVHRWHVDPPWCWWWNLAAFWGFWSAQSARGPSWIRLTGKAGSSGRNLRDKTCRAGSFALQACVRVQRDTLYHSAPRLLSWSEQELAREPAPLADFFPWTRCSASANIRSEILM